jgi:hypothetical protein
MTEASWIALIVAVAVVIVLFSLRKTLSDFWIKFPRQKGVEIHLKTREQRGNANQQRSGIRRNWMFGRRNRIHAEGPNASIEGNTLAGSDQNIEVRPSQAKNERR